MQTHEHTHTNIQTLQHKKLTNTHTLNQKKNTYKHVYTIPLKHAELQTHKQKITKRTNMQTQKRIKMQR